MPKTQRRDDSEDDSQDIPLQPKKNCKIMSKYLQHAIILEHIVLGRSYGPEELESMTIENLVIENVVNLVLPTWLNQIPSLKTIKISKCTNVSNDEEKWHYFDGFDDKSIYHTLSSVCFWVCENVSIRNLFACTPVLKTIEFHYCKNVLIDGDVCKNLEKVVLKSSPCKKFDWLKSARSIKSITLQNANLSEIPPPLLGMQLLEKVNLESNSISCVPKISTVWENVRVLKLGLVEGTKIDDYTFAGLPNLEKLKIYGSCKMNSIQPISSIPSLKTLLIQELVCSDTDFRANDMFQNLKKLSIWVDNQPFPDWVSDCKNLRYLYLWCYKNNQQSIPEYLHTLEKLKEVDFNNVYLGYEIGNLLLMHNVQTITIDNQTYNKKQGR